jgi:hypothetical protein
VAETARVLRLSSQRIRQLLAAGELRGVRDEVGHWEVDAQSVREVLEERRGALSGALDDPQRLPELEAEVRELRYLLGRSEAFLELKTKAESTLREERDRLLRDLKREHEEADRLRSELEAERGKEFFGRLFGG